MAKYTVYILQSASNGRYYVGYTGNLDDRLSRHNGNRSSWTRHKGPWMLVMEENFLTRSEVIQREKQIKSYKGGNEFKKLINRVSPR